MEDPVSFSVCRYSWSCGGGWECSASWLPSDFSTGNIVRLDKLFLMCTNCFIFHVKSRSNKVFLDPIRAPQHAHEQVERITKMIPSKDPLYSDTSGNPKGSPKLKHLSDSASLETGKLKIKYKSLWEYWIIKQVMRFLPGGGWFAILLNWWAARPDFELTTNLHIQILWMYKIQREQ